MLKGYVSSDSDDVDDLDLLYSEPPVKYKKESRPLPEVQNYKLREKLNSAIKESEKIDLFLKAADTGDLSTLEELILLGVPIDCSRNYEWTALLKACGDGNFEVVEFLLNHGSDPNLHRELLTPLMVCCNYSLIPQTSKLSCVRLLLQNGADVNMKDKYRTTALMYASESGYEDIVTELLAVPDVEVNIQDKEGLTALFYAVHSNNKIIAEKLIEAGTDLTIKDNYNRSVVNLALENGFQEMAKLLGYVEEIETNIQKQEETEANYRFLQQLPDSLGKGGFESDVKHILASLGFPGIKSTSLPNFLNITDGELYNFGVKLKPQRHKILSLIHSYHLHPWLISSIHKIHPGVPLCTEDGIAITGDLAKHLTLANASLQYLDSRLTSGMSQQCNTTTTKKVLIVILTDIYQAAVRLNVILPKILNHINQIQPELMDDYIYPYKKKRKNKFLQCLWYSCGIVGMTCLLNAFFPEVVNNMQVGISSFMLLAKSFLAECTMK